MNTRRRFGKERLPKTQLRPAMVRRLKLSTACAMPMAAGLAGLPLLNVFFPEAMATRFGGFTLTWLLLGVFFIPSGWVIAWCFSKRSSAIDPLEVATRDSSLQQPGSDA